MPELPEAETIVRGLREVLPGRTIVGVEVVRPDVLRTDPARFTADLRGRRIVDVARRGKNVVLGLDDGASLVVNLGMTGRLLPRTDPDGSTEPGGGSGPAHPAVRLRLSGGSRLVYDDVRRFGELRLLDTAAWRRWSERLGPEPLEEDFEPSLLSPSPSRTPIRSWLLDQRRVAGIGNIYANEALHRAGLHPRRPVCSLTPPEAAALVSAVRSVLREAIEARGTTLRDYRDAEGREGDFAVRLRVYGREGGPCGRCGESILRTVFGGRSAFHCPSCQPWEGRA